MDSPWRSPGDWLKAALHMHTTNSDGELAPRALARHYGRAGYDVVALTDHWHRSEAPSSPDLVVLPGVELELPPARGPGRPRAGDRIRQAVRLRIRQCRQQRHLGVPPGGQDLRRRCEQRSLHFGRLRQPSRRRDRRGNRHVQALLGRLRQQAGRHEPGPLQPDRAARATVPQPGTLRRAVERRDWSTSATE